MLKRIALLSLLFIQSSLMFAQSGKVYVNSGGQDRSVKDSTAAMLGKNKGVTKPSRDFVMIQLGYNNWVNKPDSVKTKPFGYVFNMHLCYDFPLKKSKMSFATGIGIHNSIVYLDKQMLVNNDTGSLGGAARIITDPNPGKRYKMVTTYLQAPFELRYFSNSLNRNKGFKAAIGVTVGAFLGGHTKELNSVGGTNIKYKENTKRYYSPWDFAATARIGWGNMSVFGSYNVTNVFKDNAGPALTPASVGICITGL